MRLDGCRLEDALQAAGANRGDQVKRGPGPGPTGCRSNSNVQPIYWSAGSWQAAATTRQRSSA